MRAPLLWPSRFFQDWEARIKPDILSGKRVIIAGHGNMLRVLVKHLDGISGSGRSWRSELGDHDGQQGYRDHDIT